MGNDEAFVLQQVSFAHCQLKSASAANQRFAADAHIQAAVLQLSLGVRAFIATRLPNNAQGGEYQALQALDPLQALGDLAEWVNLSGNPYSWLNKLISCEQHLASGCITYGEVVSAGASLIASTAGIKPPELTTDSIGLLLESVREIIERQLNNAAEY